MKKLVPLVLFLMLLAVPALAQQEKIPVVASFSIIGDMVSQIGGDDVQVTTLVGPDADAHEYQPTPQDVKNVAAAQILFVNGLGFEGWMGRLVQSSGFKGNVVTLTKGISPRHIEAKGDEDEHDGEDDGHDHGATDPHAWQDLRNGAIYIRNIVDALVLAKPEKAAVFKERGNEYIAILNEMDADLRKDVQSIPAQDRKIITSHDAFGYFGAAYGIKFLAPAGLNTSAEPTAADVSKLIDQIRNEGVKTVFVENMSNPRMIRQIAADTGAKLGGTLYADALSKEGGDAPTYLEMFEHNIPLVIEGMKR